MFSWFKKHFIPHEGNDHRPHFLRDLSTRNIIAVVIFLEIFSFLIPTISQLNITGGMAAVLPAVLSSLTNTERNIQNLSTLFVNPILNQAALMKAEDMATKGYFAHTSPEGKTPWYWIEKVGYKYQYAGENLAVNFSDSQDVTRAWMNSPTHKANIVKGNYTEMGTGVANGVYQGRNTVFVAQVYANPLPIPKPTSSSKSFKLKVEKLPELVKENSSNVLGAEDVVNEENINDDTFKQPSFLQKLFASPRNTTNIILNIIFFIVVLALLLYLFIQMRNHHKDLITNGLIILAVIGAVLLANYYISYRHLVITDSIDYSVDKK
ncbi:MAG: CAP domain-containing protein [Candidatus Paceibacterota bacterium]